MRLIINEEIFLKTIDEYGKIAYSEIKNFINKFDLIIKWASKGFTVYLNMDDKNICLFYFYLPQSLSKQSILTGFEYIENNVNNGGEIVKFFEENIKNLGFFEKVGKNYKWKIDKNYNNQKMQNFLSIVENVIGMIKENGLKDNFI